MKVQIGPYQANRQVEIELDDYDIWGMDHTLSLIILPLLKKFMQDHHGSPAVDNEDVPKGLHCSKIYDPTEEDKWHARWTYILGEMIHAHSAIVKDETYDTVSGPDKARVENGLRLFGKYYLHLWD